MIRDEVLHGPANSQTRQEARERLNTLLSDAQVIADLRRARAGDMEEHDAWVEHAITAVEFQTALTDGTFRARMDALEREGVLVQLFDIGSHPSGIRGRAIKLRLT